MKWLHLRTVLPFMLLIAATPGFMRLIESSSIIVCLALTGYYFIVAMTLWMVNTRLIESGLIRRQPYPKFKFYFVSLLLGSLLVLLFSYVVVRGNLLPVSKSLSPDKNRELLIFFFRGILMNSLNAFIVSHIKQLNDS